MRYNKNKRTKTQDFLIMLQHFTVASAACVSRVCVLEMPTKRCCSILRSSACRNVELVAGSQPEWEYLHRGNRQTLQIRAFSFLVFGIVLGERWWLAARPCRNPMLIASGGRGGRCFIPCQ